MVSEVWHGCTIEQRISGTPDTLARELLRGWIAGPGDIADIAPIDWANESFGN